MEIMWENLLMMLMLLFLLLIGFMCLNLLLPKRKEVENVPPGSMGLPILGETLQFFAPNCSFDVPPFIKKRKLRYGPLFKTSLIGKPVVVSTDAEVNNFIFQQEGRLFQSWYPDSFVKVVGEESVGSLHGYMYKYIRNTVLTLVGSESLKEKLMSELEDNIVSGITHWLDRIVDIKDASSDIIIDFIAKKLISYDPSTDDGGLKSDSKAFINGLLAFPLNIPGTPYYKCLKGRERVMSKLYKMFDERTENPDVKHGDFFDFLLGELKKEGTVLTKDVALNLTFVLIFASFETTSLSITLALKFLTDHPTVLKELTEEHEAILAKREDKNSNLTWKEYKSMTFTSNVISETIRLANIVPGMFRKAMEDVKIKEYTIPRGWTVMACPTAMHLDPLVYPDPLSFNPSRWKNAGSNPFGKNFVPFGGGMRLCVGTDFTMLVMAMFLHHLVTRYRWKAVKGGHIKRTPRLFFPNGYHVRFHSRQGDEHLN